MSAASDTLFKDWKATTTFLFPGQGAQYVGMAGKLVAEVPKAKEMFQQASEVLGYDLLKLCLEGPKDKLDSTVISQPAIYVASLAAVEKLRNDAGQAVIDKATVAAGLSLGEYTALSFAGAISFEDGLRIVKTRGEAMQAASEAAESGMVSVIGLDIETVEKLCARTRELTGARPIQPRNPPRIPAHPVALSLFARDAAAERGAQDERRSRTGNGMMGALTPRRIFIQVYT
jgi:[acyl-carrier-protein] S-malonyltransferase